MIAKSYIVKLFCTFAIAWNLGLTFLPNISQAAEILRTDAQRERIPQDLSLTEIEEGSGIFIGIRNQLKSSNKENLLERFGLDNTFNTKRLTILIPMAPSGFPDPGSSIFLISTQQNAEELQNYLFSKGYFCGNESSNSPCELEGLAIGNSFFSISKKPSLPPLSIDKIKTNFRIPLIVPTQGFQELSIGKPIYLQDYSANSRFFGVISKLDRLKKRVTIENLLFQKSEFVEISIDDLFSIPVLPAKDDFPIGGDRKGGGGG